MAENKKTRNTASQNNLKISCGIIMPISSFNGYSSNHWVEILSILKEVNYSLGFNCDLVSESDTSHIIQTRIVHNLYDNDIVICDVSGNNPNVMFELGMRLAFDKPTIVIKDTKTANYNFDISPIQHLSYPTDKNYYQIQSFQRKLEDRLNEFLEAKKKGEKFSTYLEAFGKIRVAEIEEKEGSIDQVLLSSLEELKNLVSNQISISLRKSEEFNNNYYLNNSDWSIGRLQKIAAKVFTIHVRNYSKELLLRITPEKNTSDVLNSRLLSKYYELLNEEELTYLKKILITKFTEYAESKHLSDKA